jgi:hypothetical protein
LDFDPSARLHVSALCQYDGERRVLGGILVSLTENLDFILQPWTDAAHVHKVKVVAVHPLIFDVVD